MRRIFFQRQSSGQAPLQVRGRWFFYRGHPVYLIGGGGTRTIYGPEFASAAPGWSLDDSRNAWLRYLDRMAESGGVNLLRFFPWAACWDESGATPDWASPLSGDGKLRPNDRFLETLRWICRQARDRSIFLIITIFDDHTLSPGGLTGGPWMRNPWNAQRGGPCARPADFYDIDTNARTRETQETWARAVYSAAQGSGNVLFEVMSEIGSTAAATATADGRRTLVRPWLRHHLEIARRMAPGYLLGVSGNSWSEGTGGGSADELWDEPDLDVLLPHEIDARSALLRGATARQFRFYDNEGIGKPRIVGETRFPGVTGDTEERRHHWVAFVNGGHAAPARAENDKMGVSPAWASAKSLTTFLTSLGTEGPLWWDMEPLDTPPLAPVPERVYALGNRARGEQIVYLLERPETAVSLCLPNAPTVLRWIDTLTGEVGEPQIVTDKNAPLRLPPGRGDVAFWIKPDAD